MKLEEREVATDLGSEAAAEISEALRPLLPGVFALYLTTKNFHWHMSGRHFQDYHLLLDRARKVGGTTIRSISDIAAHQRLKDNNDEFVASSKMIAA